MFSINKVMGIVKLMKEARLTKPGFSTPDFITFSTVFFFRERVTITKYLAKHTSYTAIHIHFHI